MTTLNASAVDAIEYSRRRGVREILNPSVYKEGSLRVRYRQSEKLFWELSSLYGKRDADSLSRAEYTLGVTLPTVINNHFDIYGLLGSRRNFTSNDLLARAGLGWFSRQWELTWDEEYMVENQDGGSIYHPLTTELSIARTFADSLFATISVQDVRDERVQILAAYFRLTYRFGNKEISPIRDGAPPRGRL